MYKSDFYANKIKDFPTQKSEVKKEKNLGMIQPCKEQKRTFVLLGNEDLKATVDTMENFTKS